MVCKEWQLWQVDTDADYKYGDFSTAMPRRESLPLSYGALEKSMIINRVLPIEISNVAAPYRIWRKMAITSIIGEKSHLIKIMSYHRMVFRRWCSVFVMESFHVVITGIISRNKVNRLSMSMLFASRVTAMDRMTCFASSECRMPYGGFVYFIEA